MPKNLLIALLLAACGVSLVLFQNCGRVSMTASKGCVGMTCAETPNNKSFYSGVSEKAFDRGRGPTSRVH